ncbi:MAG: tRNA 4-thiouridine(8) synthase ThiI, partial [Nanoarchaeota archaeon]|nr:tRNA 4-thiouridine(8) synthase ThiI [Nanoarchaeota archaeon]
MKGLLLISGGIDSPVAGKMMIERGASLIAIHFSNEPFTSDEPEKKSLETAKIIGVKKVIVINLSEEFSQIVKNCNHRYYFVLTKRLMLRVAEKIAGKEDCDFLVTG